jgi:hypothetical protein
MHLRPYTLAIGTNQARIKTDMASYCCVCLTVLECNQIMIPTMPTRIAVSKLKSIPFIATAGIYRIHFPRLWQIQLPTFMKRYE